MNRIESIIYELLYTKENIFKIDLTGLKEHIEDYFDLTESIVNKVNKGSVYIIEDIISIDNEKVYWDVKIKRD